MHAKVHCSHGQLGVVSNKASIENAHVCVAANVHCDGMELAIDNLFIDTVQLINNVGKFVFLFELGHSVHSDVQAL